ncbi:MAG: cellobiose phosphorylase [Anaerolineales bacterium]|nr:cellobiose phosphorylase [Anaerolineales bacterium]
MTNRLFESLPAVEQNSGQQTSSHSWLEQAAQQAAASHCLASGRPEPDHEHEFLERPLQQEQRLRAAYRHFRQNSEAELTLSYAAEWLLDNYYVVQQVLRQIREDLPSGYYRRLPKLDSDSFLAGFPRSYAVARELVLHEQAQLDLARIEQFMRAYQTVAPLTMGEVWALPIMLRFALLESLAQAASRLIGQADAASSSWALQFDHEVADADVVARCIPSLRLLATQDWKLFFEHVSHVEHILRDDPVGIYARMDFDTRNHYRTVIEELAWATGQAEVDVAHAAVEMAAVHLASPLSAQPFETTSAEAEWACLTLPREAHVGFYLVDAGLAQLETHFNYRPTGLAALRRAMLTRPALFYLGAAGLLSLFIVTLLVGYALNSGGTPWQVAGAALLTFIPAITIAIYLVNWLVTRLLPPRILPKLDLQEGIPLQCRTMVVIPALLTHPGEVESLLSQLELHYLRNTDPHLTFALLTDFADAPQEHMPEDEALIAQARQGLEALNQRHDHRPFYLFHRRRLWNSSENAWIGWERKRGKLHEFNRLLRGDRGTSYTVQVGELSILPAIRYVITLDADTILPRDSAHRLIGALAHPLNRAQFNAATGQITAGYTVLQPRTEIKPASANQSLFTQVFAGDTGLDLYTLAVSDVYQDLFGAGIYVGKGIYDVDAFEASLKGRVPENALLSHDLFEGIHGRAGLVTDIILYEDYPPHYLVHIYRSHRWIRGDWQLLPWLWPRVPHADKGITSSPLSLLDRWKIADNLRRSLLPPALLLLFLAGWLWLPGSPLAWTLLGLFTPAWPFLTSIVTSAVRLINRGSWPEIRRSIHSSALRWLLAIAFLPYESVLALDAIFTTLTRLFITRRRLMQWTTAAHTARLFGAEVKSRITWRQMISAVLVSGILALLILLINPGALPAAVPLLGVWLLSPEIAYGISRPVAARREQLTSQQRQQLHSLARRTWLFFEQFVGPQDNWLPPDHFQESPRGVVAHRTSPTNVGLYLLSTLGAYDMGYVDAMELALHLRATFDTLKRLERYRGHFLNWIDTQTLHPLPPRYASTVDSGNLAACLLTLKQGCLAVSQRPLWGWVRWQGFLDTLALLDEMVAELDTGKSAAPAAAIQAHLAALTEQVLLVRDEPAQWPLLLAHLLADALPRLDQLLLAWIEAESAELHPAHLHNLRRYVERVHHHLESVERQLKLLLPWLLPLTRPPALFSQPDLEPSIAAAWQSLVGTFPATAPPMNEVKDIYRLAQSRLVELQKLLPNKAGAARAWCAELTTKLRSAEVAVKALQIEYQQLSDEAESYLQEMDFSFLFNPLRQVFHIGYNLDAGRLDDNYYDLLASEARLASLIAIAKYEVPQSHWLHLGRPLRHLPEGPTLLSWNGTMFEYLMPPLLVRTYPGTLLQQSEYAAATYQRAYGRQKGIPWGISESGYYAFDANLNYQYRAFGAPALGFKRGLSDDLVIAPYASLLALPLLPQAVVENITHLTRLKMLGRYGLYEALDYTPVRLTLGQEQAIVASYMAHHQGMMMLSLVNYLQEEVMIRRFHAEPRIQSIELLLQERIPEQLPDNAVAEADVPATGPGPVAAPIAPWEVAINTPIPQVHYLSNGQYHVLLTNTGGGYSRWQEVGLTRWRADTTLDNWGSWLYLQDLDSGTLWSAGYQPTGAVPESQRVLFHPHMAEFHRRDHDIALTMQVTVAPDDDVEIRLVTLTNESEQPRRLRLTSYGEVSLASPAADERHPAFAKLFVQSEYLPETNTLLFRRRPRSAGEERVYLGHLLIVEPEQPLTGAYESSRAHFLGRTHPPADPAALASDDWLSGTVGATLDPIFALGQIMELPPHTSVRLAWLTLAAATRQAALDLAERYQRWRTLERAFNQARTQSEFDLRQLGFDTDLLRQTQQLLGLLLYPHRARRAEPATLAANQQGQPGLWPFAISGDYPILLVSLRSEEDLPLAQELLQAHIYWRQRQLKVDLVFLNRQEAGYGQALQGDLFRLIQRAGSDTQLNQRGGIFLLLSSQLGEADLILLETAARVILDGQRGSLAAQLAGLYEQPTRLPEHTPVLSPAEAAEPMSPLLRPAHLQFDNGWGGFSPDGQEYLIFLRPGETTPAPWINVIANENFGFLVSETGGGYSWAVNSGENRLSAWRNDPVTDLPGEALYLRDEETAEIWSPTPQPAPAAEPYLVRHGAGYTVFEHHSHGLRQHLRLFVAPDAPVKVVQLRLENEGTRPRRITATYYLEWVLGVNRETSQPYLTSEYDEVRRALLACNPYNVEFGQRVAFVAASKAPHGLTADRTEFLGQLGSMSRPAGLRRIGLEGRVEVGLDPCAALQLHLDLTPGASEEIYFLIGQGADRAETESLLERFQDPAQVAAAWQGVQTMWADILGAVQVDTPDPALNLLLNRWLLYQTLACRIWGRSALYQSSGAYGYRDQLQDVLALLHSRPDLAREHILRAARHQFTAGDVLHWWHPPSGRGVRTLIRDDLLWLPYVVAHYVAVTGDETILQVKVSFLKGEPLKENEEERYGYYDSTEELFSLYEHCRRALMKGDTSGPHGLPLMGSGDWNDGMNRVGSEGQGESVWLGWFLDATLMAFADLCDRTGEAAQASAYRQRAKELRQAMEANAWDGAWYRRATYDDGTPLGSARNRECQIDAIAQSWAVLSQAADPPRAKKAMAAVLERLVRWDERLILLFTPPFDKTPRDPGYIKGYLPGIRENGGQYTHAALWTIWAVAQLGDGDQADALFRLINPVYRADTPEKVARYQVEPYVISADVYSVPPHTGRGGWTWYTGSAGWMYRLGLEAMLGLRREGAALRLDPCIPKSWPGFTVTYRYGQTVYEIRVENVDGVNRGVKQILLDGQPQSNGTLPLQDDGRHHRVEVKL